MLSIKDKFKERGVLIHRPPDLKITNERQFVIKEFLDRLNTDRKPPYKPLNAGFVASKMSMLSLSQLKTFLGECKYQKNFSKFWWWSVNPKKHNDIKKGSEEVGRA